MGVTAQFPATCRSCEKSFVDSRELNRGIYVKDKGILVQARELKCSKGHAVMQPNCKGHSPIKI